MIADALNLFKSAVEGAAGAGSKVKVLDLPKDPHKFAIVKADGAIDILPAAPPSRGHALGSLDQVGDFVRFAVDELGASPTVWYDEEAIVVILADTPESQRQDAARVKLTTTTTYRQLRRLGDEWIPQKEFVRLLRIGLEDAATDSSRQLLRVCRVIGFSNSAGVASTVEHGRQSLGRDIEQQVKSEVGDLPEEITLNVRIFNDPSLTRRFAIRCAVDVDPRNATFNLCPLPGCLDDAVDEQMALIGQELHSTIEVPVFRGRPA